MNAASWLRGAAAGAHLREGLLLEDTARHKLHDVEGGADDAVVHAEEVPAPAIARRRRVSNTLHHCRHERKGADNMHAHEQCYVPHVLTGC